MKKIAFFTACSLAAMSLTGCVFTDAIKAGFKEGLKESLAEQIKENNSEPTSQTEATHFYKEYSIDKITFKVDSSWDAMDEKEGAFITPDQKCVYMFQGSSALGSYEPMDFYNELTEMYSETLTIKNTVPKLDEFTAIDGTQCFAGTIDMQQENGVIYCVDVLIAPAKNFTITYSLQHGPDTEPPVELRKITESTVFNLGIEDKLSNSSFITNMGLDIRLHSDNSFEYYAEAVSQDNGFLGTYEVYRGKEAQDKLVSMTEYGLTEDELQRTLKSGMDGYKVGGVMPSDYTFDEDGNLTGYDIEDSKHICLDNFYALILNVDTMIEEGVSNDSDGTALYFGYYIEDDNIFDLISANTATYTQWYPNN